MQLLLGVRTAQEPSDIFNSIHWREAVRWILVSQMTIRLQEDAELQCFHIIAYVNLTPLEAVWETKRGGRYFAHISALNVWAILLWVILSPHLPNWLIIPKGMFSEELIMLLINQLFSLWEWLPSVMQASVVLKSPSDLFQVIQSLSLSGILFSNLDFALFGAPTVTGLLCWLFLLFGFHLVL